MNTSEATILIGSAVPSPGGVWSDIGAGEGTFTRALAELLGPDGRIYAVDQDAEALAALDREMPANANVTTVVADFTRQFELPGLHDPLDGILLANALHFMRDAATVLARLVTHLAPGGRVVFVEYDKRGPSRWVPFPIPTARLLELASIAGLTKPVITATRPSEYGGDLYVAWAERQP